MATRRALWPRARLNGLGPPLATRYQYETSISRNKRATPLPSSRQHQVRHHASSALGHGHLQHQFRDALPPAAEGAELDALLVAIQRQDAPRIYEAFVAWTGLLADEAAPRHEAALQELQEIPGPTFSEILRSVDPIVSSAHDVAHGLNFSRGQAQFIYLESLLDEFGIRRVHRKILSGMAALVEARGGSRLGLAPSDYDIFMRCAGAAMDYHLSKKFWNAMTLHGLSKARTATSWTEFIKARFLTEPLYYQFDRSRVAVMARDLYSNREPLPVATIKRLERKRLSIHAFNKRVLWNRRPDQPDEDLRRLYRRRGDYRGFKNHWIRSIYYGHEMDEELLCTSMIAFARSSSLFAIRTHILGKYYGVTIQNASDPAKTVISGGFDFAPESLITPTPRLLHAIVEAFGSMSHIALGSRLVDFFSRRYNIPIPHETWSNLLSWTYLCASKPFRTMRRIHGPYASTRVTTEDVRQVWDVMTSEPYSVAPTFDDLDIIIKSLIFQRSFHRALSIIRTHAMPLYQSIVENYQSALFDEILQANALSSSSSDDNNNNNNNNNKNNNSNNNNANANAAIHRRKMAEILRDRTHHLISNWFTNLLKSASQSKPHRAGAFARTAIPNLLLEFPDFFHPQIRYRTTQGHVHLEAPPRHSSSSDAAAPYTWTSGFRIVPASKLPGYIARRREGSDAPEFAYPVTREMRVREWVRRPRRRVLVRLRPRKGHGREQKDWWEHLEKQLML